MVVFSKHPAHYVLIIDPEGWEPSQEAEHFHQTTPAEGEMTGW